MSLSAIDARGAGGASAATTFGRVGGFVTLLVLSGVANGSVYKMFPPIFEARSPSLDISEAERQQWSRRRRA